MDTPPEIAPIIEALAAGQITAEDAVARIVAAGLSDERARYIVRSMEAVDVVDRKPMP